MDSIHARFFITANLTLVLIKAFENGGKDIQKTGLNVTALYSGYHHWWSYPLFYRGYHFLGRIQYRYGSYQ
jgi:hypothetical protein